MKLTKLYTTPFKIFEPVTFHSGINIILGKKDKSDASLNAIGKSLFLDFIEFALLGNFKSDSSSRLAYTYKKSKIRRITIHLEFESGNNHYKISRSFKNPNEAHFFINKKEYDVKSIKKLQHELSNIIFERDDYLGEYRSSWYSNLLSFYMKIQKITDQRFTDPIRFIDKPMLEIYQYLLFLLNINNKLLHESIQLLSDISRLEKSKSATEEFVKTNYSFSDIAAAKTQIDQITRQINKLKKDISKIEFADEYKNSEKELNEITSNLKKQMFLRRSILSRLDEFKELTNNPDNINTEHVEELFYHYSQNPQLATIVKKSLDEVKEFRSNLHSSRRTFLLVESDRLNRELSKKDELIDKLVLKQKQILKLLNSEKALEDLNENYNKLSRLEAKRTQIESKIDLFSDIESEIKNLKKEDMHLNIIFDDYLKTILNDLQSLRHIMNDLYTSIFGNVEYNDLFNLTRIRDKNKIQIEIIPDDKHSHGKNQGRTLVFDLSVLFKSVQQNYNAPRFLIHDGIFDSLDDSHFVALYEYCDKKLNEGLDFQYIVTLNERLDFENLLNASKILTKQRLDTDTIITIDASKGLLGEKF